MKSFCFQPRFKVEKPKNYEICLVIWKNFFSFAVITRDYAAKKHTVREREKALMPDVLSCRKILEMI